MKTLYLFLIVCLLVSGRSYSQYDSLRPQGIYKSNFIIDQVSRDITYYMPLNYGKLDSYPLVIFLHGEKSSAAGSIKKYGELLHHKADSADCVIMYPDAINGHWNSKLDQKDNGKDSINDVSFLGIMLNFFIQQYHCDAKRIYLLGIGKGGDMCYRFNCESSIQPSAMVIVNTLADTSHLQNCRKRVVIPIKNINSEANINLNISSAWEFLFSNLETK